MGRAVRILAIVGALDTKGLEIQYAVDQVQRRGHQALVIDVGVMGEPLFAADIPRARVAEAAGATLHALVERADRGEAIAAMARGAERVAADLFTAGRIHGVLGLGGSAGTMVATAAMRALPLGVPKVMLTTLASGDTAPYVGTKDVVLFPSVVDIAGLNRISRRLIANAVGAAVGMLESAGLEPGAGTGSGTDSDRPIVAATMFGNTTPCVDRARERVESRGYEVLVFHATGTGGRTMEALVEDGYITGVMDITTTEWADELVGGVLGAGPGRLDAAAHRGIPQVIVPGCLDMANFWARETIPDRFAGRRFYEWNPNVTLMRTTPEENARLGQILADKAGRSTGPVAILLPRGGVSMLDSPGKEFWWPEADRALFDAIHAHAGPHVRVVEIEANINDPSFADTVADTMLGMLEAPRPIQESVPR